jgi:hypothetical protein
MIIRPDIFRLGRRRRHDASSSLLAFLWAFLLTGLGVNAAGKGNAEATTTTSQTPQATQDTPQATTTEADDNNTNASQQQTSTTEAKTTAKTSSESTTLPNLFTTTNAKLPGLSTSSNLPSLATGLPKLTENTAGIPTYQVVIPQMAGNPYLDTSSFPEGTVFIIVGSCLAGLALVLIFSRAAYIWFLHRQTSRTKDVKYSEMEKRPFTGATMSSNPFAGFNNSAGAGGTISLEYLRSGDRSSRVSTFSSRPSTARPGTMSSMLRPTSTLTRPNSSVNPLGNPNVQFYSPSAHPGSTGAMGTQGNRNSEYMPSGYYLREPTNSTNMRDPSPRQMYAAPAQNNSSFLYTDPTAPPVPRLTRTPTGNSTGAPGTRPSTGGGSNGNGGGSFPPGGQVYNSQARRAPSSYGDPAGGDRRSKPSQVLDEMLRG